jgi:hypothetical protein
VSANNPESPQPISVGVAGNHANKIELVDL